MENRNFIRMVGVMLLFCVVAAAFHGSQKRIESAIDDSFKYAIEQDYQNRKLYLVRKSANRIRYGVRDYALSPSFSQKIGSYSLRTTKGVYTYQFKDSIYEEAAKRLLTQHLLDEVNRLNVNQVKSYFQERLKQKDIEAHVGVLCLRDTVRYWSDADSIVPKEAYSTPRQVLDIAGKIKVQAWADYSWGTLFAHLDPVVYIFLLLLIGVLMWIWPRRKPQLELEDAEEEEPMEELLIDLEKNELYINGVPCVIAKLDLALLSLLYERLGECVSREEIKQQFWSMDENSDEKIHAHIKNIRKILKDSPYQLVTVRGKGYYLERT